MDNGYIKIGVFLLVVTAMAGLTFFLMDRGLGAVEEARRVKHPAGFSIVVPKGWESQSYFAAPPKLNNSIALSPTQSAGPQPRFAVVRFETTPKAIENAVESTFQGQPASIVETVKRDATLWTARFQREGMWFEIAVRSFDFEPVMSGQWRGFIESFRVHASASTSPTTLPLSGVNFDASKALQSSVQH